MGPADALTPMAKQGTSVGVDFPLEWGAKFVLLSATRIRALRALVNGSPVRQSRMRVKCSVSVGLKHKRRAIRHGDVGSRGVTSRLLDRNTTRYSGTPAAGDLDYADHAKHYT